MSRIARLIAAALAIAIPFGRGMAEPAGGGWQVVLAAGDDAEPVFDDATRTLAGMFAAAGVPARGIHRLSASPAEIARGAEPADKQTLLRRIAALAPLPGERCFVFLTSHGEHGEGLWLARSQRALHPDELAAALSRGCGAAPTVAIVSGCYTGAFARGAMARPNRIILTAARADRPSFGCQVRRRYTFFDQCLLAALPRAANWRRVSAATDRCVSRMERRLKARPSEPQAYFGAAAATLPVGLRP
jgi:Peptidase C13 family